MSDSIRVLVVEDSVADMEIDIFALESAGFEVSARRVESESAYLRELKENPPDIVLSDHSMPRFDAQRALHILRSEGMDIPFILVSGQIGELAAVDLMKAGANDFVIKSELARLAPAVRREIREHRERREALQTRQRLAERERTLETLMHNLPGMVYRLVEKEGTWRFDFASNGAEDLTGYSPESLMLDDGLRFDELVHDGIEGVDDCAGIIGTLEQQSVYTGEHRIMCCDGGVKWVWHRATALPVDEQRERVIEGFIADITPQKLDQARLRYLAHHDVLTGLVNRTLFEDELTTSVARAKRLDSGFSLLFIDLDNFKDINDTAGHAAGDALLRVAAERLMDVSRTSDTVARLGGDEFAILVDVGNATQEAAAVAQRVIDALTQPFEIDGRLVRISASIGIATYPEDGITAASLLSNADAAMYSAKLAGRATYQFFASEMNDRAHEMVEMRSLIPDAVKEDQFELHFQAQARLDSHEIVGAEALLRWHHPLRGFLSAGAFVPVAEEGGLVHHLDGWVMAEACRQVGQWISAGIDVGQLSFNLSARQFHEPGLAERLGDLCAEHGISPTLLEVEVTETAMMQDSDSARRVIANLRDLGLTVALDDFGKGYSSLSYLKRFAVDRLKIDRAFVCDLPGDADDLQICRSIIALAESMDIEVVAEGIETAEQSELLRSIGCPIGQGYHFGRPVSAQEFTRDLHQKM